MNPGEKSPERTSAPVAPETLDTIEAGRLKERLIEAVKILPGTLADMAKLYVLAAKSLGTSQEEIDNQLKEITSRMIERSDTARGVADEKFEDRIAS